jgi:hypothetical protein
MGLNLMGVRYPVAVALAYLVFLGLVGIWLSLQRRYSRARLVHDRSASRDSSGSGSLVTAGDAVDVATDLDSGLYLLPALSNGSSSAAASSTDGAGSVLKGIGDVDDAKGIVVLIVVGLIVLAVCASLLACAYVIWEAPVLLAEVLVNGGLMAGMARRLRAEPDQHWTMGVIRRTWPPAFLVGLSFCLVGFGLAWATDGATSMGHAIHKVLN